MEIKEIRISEITISEHNTRKDLTAGIEDAGIEDLAQSIKENGLLNPLIVMYNKNGTYSLIVGQRRFLACQKLGLQTVPVIIREISESTEATILSLIENVHRADMSPMDKARAYEQIYLRYNDYKKVAKETGISVPTIKRYLKLLELAPSIQDQLTTSDGPTGIAALSKLATTFSSPEEQVETLKEISGFKQQIQLEILRQSEGDFDKIKDLKEQAMGGAFAIAVCKGLETCSFIPEELIDVFIKAIKKHQKGEKIVL